MPRTAACKDIDDEKVEAPIFVTGMGPAGTTVSA